MLILLVVLLQQDPTISRVTFCAVGDVLLDRGIRRAIDDNSIDYPFALVAPYITQNDLAFCNLECPVSAKGHSTGKIYCFRADTSFFAGVKDAGFNIFSLANNHIIDWGQDACLDTRALIESQNLHAVGVGEDQDIAREPIVIVKQGQRFAFFALLGDPLKGVVWSEQRPGPAQAEIEDICNAIGNIRYDVDYIIVSIHWGIEYMHMPSAAQISWAHAMIDAGADLIVGHHPHVLQSIEVYKDRIILYSLGNFVFDQHKTYQKQTGIFSCIFKHGRIDSAAFTPCYISEYRPAIADSAMYNVIKNKLVVFCKDFNAQFFDNETELLITDSTLTFSLQTPLAQYNIINNRITVFDNCIELRDLTCKLIALFSLLEGEQVNDCCIIPDTDATHLILLIQKQGEDRQRYIMHTTPCATGFTDTWCAEDIRMPWKIQSADLTGDGHKELCIAVNTQELHQSEPTNKLRIYSWNGSECINLWNGSRRSTDFVDFICQDLDMDGLEELYTLETADKDQYTINTYQWLGKGFSKYPGIADTVKTRWIEDALFKF